MKSPPAICFDMDATVLDDSEVHFQAFNAALERHRLKLIDKYDWPNLFGKTTEQILDITSPGLSERKKQAVALDKKEFLLEKTKHVKVYPGVSEALQKLKEKYKLILISNSKRDVIFQLIKHSELPDRIFDLIIAADDIKNPKPAPDAILAVNEYIDVKVEYMVGDSIQDIEAGKAARVKTIAVLTGKAGIETLNKANPDLILRSVADIPETLEDLNEE